MNSDWVKILFEALAFLMTWTLGIVSLTRMVGKIEKATTEKIDNETKEITDKLEKLQAQFDQDQRTQDHNFGEVGASLRQFISNVEKEMHQIEIWGRDNYVLKSEFLSATDSIRADIKSLGADIKADLRILTQKIDTK